MATIKEIADYVGVSSGTVSRVLNHDSTISVSDETGININQNDLSSQVKILSRSNGGSVAKIKLGNKELTGRDIRNILNLNSANFEIKFDTNSLDFVVKGYGHGVGMSQWGANGMAEEGYKYYEILSHYYKDTTIKDLY